MKQFIATLLVKFLHINKVEAYCDNCNGIKIGEYLSVEAAEDALEKHCQQVQCE